MENTVGVVALSDSARQLLHFRTNCSTVAGIEFHPRLSQLYNDLLDRYRPCDYYYIAV